MRAINIYEAKKHYLQDKGSQTTDGVDNGNGSSFISRICFPQPGTPHNNQESKKAQSDCWDNLGEEPYLPVDDKVMCNSLIQWEKTNFWMVVIGILNLVSPDIATIHPMIVLSPVAKTTPVQVPWITNVNERARLWVSSAFCEVRSIVPGIG